MLPAKRNTLEIFLFSTAKRIETKINKKKIQGNKEKMEREKTIVPGIPIVHPLASRD